MQSEPSKLCDPQVRELTVLWISRNVFDHLRRDRLTAWQRGRVVHNDAAIVHTLSEAIEVARLPKFD